jgi:cytochrome c biogenesis protein
MSDTGAEAADAVGDQPGDLVEVAAGLSTGPEPEPAALPSLGVVGWLRWAWRQLTSMRVALLLLFLLALAAIPGSLLPQRGTAPGDVSAYLASHPGVGPWFDRLGLFDVFASAWFAAIYLLLMVSLAGCVLPRLRVHWRAMRGAPPAAPRRLARQPEHRALERDGDLGTAGPEVLAEAEATLSAGRWRVLSSRYDPADPSSGWVAAEKGYLRETGNLLFHLSLLVLLVAVGLGAMYGARGQVLVVEGDGFSDTLPQYDTFTPGRSFDPASLPPFTITLDDFRATYEESGAQRGSARDFVADVRYRATPDGAEQRTTIAVNEPLEVDGSKVFLVGHGYAPTVRITDRTGKVVFDDSVVFLPQDGNFTSSGVIKVPDADPQLGFTAVFLPTAEVDPVRGGFSSFPAARAPELFLSVWKGDLGLDSGRPQSVYRLDTDKLTRLGLHRMKPGQTWVLPEGLGTLELTGFKEYATFSVARDPGKGLALAAALLAIAGLTLSLFVRRRRVWVRVSDAGQGRTLVEVAGLGRTEAPGLAVEVDQLASALTRSST